MEFGLGQLHCLVYDGDDVKALNDCGYPQSHRRGLADPAHADEPTFAIPSDKDANSSRSSASF